MTNRQRQLLLAYLGYYVGDITDQWTAECKVACKAFQEDFQGIQVDGWGGPETDKALRHGVAYDMFRVADAVDVPIKSGSFWGEIEFFTRGEFRCQCGGKHCNGFPVEPDEAMVRTVNEIRRRLGVPVQIVDAGGSGVRCPQHNAAVGGVANSNHLYGRAADLHSSKSPEEMARVAEEVMGNTGELGIYSWGIHVAVNCSYSRYRG